MGTIIAITVQAHVGQVTNELIISVYVQDNIE